MSATLTSAPAVRTYAHVVKGTVVETLSTAQDISDLFPASLTWFDVTALTPQPSAGWSFSGTVFSAPAVVAPAAPKLTSLQFLGLLTAAEQQAIMTAGLANASVMLWLLKVTGATFVDLGDPTTIAGVDAIAAVGLLTSARAAAILANQAPPATTTTTATTVSGGAS